LKTTKCSHKEEAHIFLDMWRGGLSNEFTYKKKAGFFRVARCNYCWDDIGSGVTKKEKGRPKHRNEDDHHQQEWTIIFS